MKKINPANSSFETMIRSGCIYVDKTGYLRDMLSLEGAYYFLSRPRRFGKTLSVSTLECIFRNRRDLFKGLQIDSSDYEWKEYPVIRMDFSKCCEKNPDRIAEWLGCELDEIARGYGVELDARGQGEKFDQLIRKLSAKGKVAVLIDEYDAPLSNNIGSPDIDRIREVFRGLFSVLKANCGCVRMVFITGVTKYAKVSIFSSMNNLIDISMMKKYANILGYTQQELERDFTDCISEGVAASGMKRDDYMEKLKRTYDGYCFCPGTATLYNPVSIGQFFMNGGEDFDNYWIQTGGTRFLAEIARKTGLEIEDCLNTPFSKNEMEFFDITEADSMKMSLNSFKFLLFQTGYLTISKALDKNLYLLNYPNQEVRRSFAVMMLNQVHRDDENSFSPSYLLYPLKQGNIGGMIEYMKALFGSIPYYLSKENNTEAHYHQVFHAALIAAGAKLSSEMPISDGRIDSVLQAGEHLYIFEFKLDGSAGEALRQIEEKDYAVIAGLFGAARKTHLVGVCFSSKTRNITGYLEKPLERKSE